MLNIKDKKTLSIIIPCYNEAENIIHTKNRIIEQINKLQMDYELVFIDDGSTDGTKEILNKLHNKNKKLKAISFSKNFGHQAAIIAGLHYAKGNAVIMMDADLQHPPELIPKMINEWKSGFDIINTIRGKNKEDTIFKRTTSGRFYRTINLISNTKIPNGTADFRLMDRKVVDAFKDIEETNLFIRGMINWLGFSSTYIKYTPNKRHAGKTKYTFRKMMSLAFDGITSFSTAPLQMATLFGLIISAFSFLYLLYAIYIRLFTTQALAGWTSVI
ncbi:MAG: glycosyltransferase family 2 protein, partial [Candidatus Aenigmarchaeota archaeon]|nr:glycosyltransferase family 2 protein [Candidatus Aenigmarchaeota archaeon]